MLESLEVRAVPAVLSAFLTTEHVDLDISYTGGINGTWSLQPRAGDLAVTYSPDEALLYVGDNTQSRVSRPSGPSFDFIGVGAGEPFYSAPQSQNPELIYLGFAGYGVPSSGFDRFNPLVESKGRVSGTGPWIKVSLVDIKHFTPEGQPGQGQFSVWQSGENGPNVFMATANDGASNPNSAGLDTTDGIGSDDALWIIAGGHTHYNWGFSEKGRYEVEFQVSGHLNDGNTTDLGQAVQSEPIKLYFSVGSVGELEFDSASYVVNEADGTATIGVRRVGGSDGRVHVEYATSDGTAAVGSDYSAAAGTLTFNDGETYKTITVPVVGDSHAEADETVNFLLSKPGPASIDGYYADYEADPNGLLGSRVTATLTILDDDALLPNTPPTISYVPDQITHAGTPASVDFAIGDAETPPDSLVVTVSSSNTTLVPDANIVLGGSGANRTLAIRPAANQVGATTITVTVTDGAGLQTIETFVVTMTANRLVPFGLPSYYGALSANVFNSVSADFNGDGVPDLIVASGGTNTLGYLQGTGDGGFLPGLALNAGLDLLTQGIVDVDYDGDGDVDLLAYEFNQATSDGTANEATLTLYRNDGTGQFSRVVLKNGMVSGSSIAAGDFNEDGRVDVAYVLVRYDRAASMYTSAIQFALQRPTGELGPETTLSTGFGDLLIDDLDGDGNLDLIVLENTFTPPSTLTSKLQVYSGNGDGTFVATQSMPTGAYASLYQLADMNGDGRIDAVVGDRVDSYRAGYYPRQPDGSFGAFIGLLPGIGQLNSIGVVHFNGDGVLDIVSSTYSSDFTRVSVAWTPGLGGGAYGAPIMIAPHNTNVANFHVVDLDGDSHPDLVAAGNSSTVVLGPVAVYLNKTGENPMVLLPPVGRSYVAGDPIDVQVYFGFPITVTGTPRLALQVGGNVVYANYVSGSGTPTLRFRYTVAPTDVDLDGVQLASHVIDLNSGTLTDPIDGDGVLEFPTLAFSGVIVNGAGPLVEMISRLDANSTGAGSVRFAVQFAEAVTGVDAADFAVIMNAGDLAGAAVVSVSGSGSLYEVTVSTGTGSGTLGLSILGTASVHDLNGDVLGKGYAGGQVYTVRPTLVGDNDTYYVEGHADYRPIYNDGEFSYVLHGDPLLLPNGESPSDEITSYLDSTALVSRPEAATYDFLGVAAGAPYYLSPSSGNIATVPYLGFSGESLVAGTFAAYRPDDPRITSSTPYGYLKVQLVGMRSSSDGDFSIYSIASGNPRVWMATSDGISNTDNIWTRAGSHSHFNVAFSEAGRYEVDIVISGYLDSNGNGVYDPIVDPYVESGIKTLVFGVDSLGARDDAYTVHGQNTLHGSVTMNDEWHGGLEEMTASVVTTTTKGSLSLQPDGSFTYVPSVAFDGTDRFVYRLTNPREGSTTATVTITAAGPQDFHTILQDGHTDVGVAFEDGEWNLHVHDEENDSEYEPAEALLYVGPQALTSRTGGLAGPAFDFLGVATGETFYSLPQTQNPELLFLGIGAEELGNGVFAGDAVTLRLKAVNGPGHFSLWQSGDLGPSVAMATSDGITSSDRAIIQAGSHAHYHWTFTARGRYEVTFAAVAKLPDGTEVESGAVTYDFSVDNLGQLQLDAPTYSVGENGAVTVTVHRIGGSDGPLSVGYGATGGTATPDVDFASFGGTLIFLDGETEKTFTIVILPDTMAEGTETVIVSLVASEGSPTRLGSPSEAILMIGDDDPPIPADGVISGHVFIDSLNHNGLRDLGEAGVAGVRLVLTGSDDRGPIEPRSVMTSADGSYRFEGLRPGTYRVTEAQPDGLLDGSDSRGPSGVLPDSHRSDAIDGITLAPSGVADAINFGELRPGRIAGSVYEDLDGNALRRDGEPGIAGVIVTLTGTDDLGPITPWTIRTNADGTYSFDHLRPGMYTVTEVQPDGFHDGWETRDNVVALPESAGADTIPIRLSPGQSLVENHFSEVRQPVSEDPVPEPPTAVMARVVNRRTIALFFSSPIDAARASTLAHYRLNAVGLAGQSVPRGARAVPLRVASYNANANFVRLTISPRFRLRNNLTYQLDVDRQIAVNPSAGFRNEGGTRGDYSVLFTRGRSVSSYDGDGDWARFTTRSRSLLELHRTLSGAVSRLYVQPTPGRLDDWLEVSVTQGSSSDGLFDLPLLEGVERFRSNPAKRLTIGQIVPRGPIVPSRL